MQFLNTLGKFERHRLRRLAQAHEEGVVPCCERRLTDWSVSEEHGASFILGTAEIAGAPAPVVALVLGAHPQRGVNTDECWLIPEGVTAEDLVRLEAKGAVLRRILLGRQP